MATKLHPYLNFAGNAEEAFLFYKSVFGGEFSSVVRFSEMPMPAELSEADGKKIAHIGLPIGEDATLMASDILEVFGQQLVVGNNAYISIHPPTRDEATRLFRELSAGGDVEMDIADQPWGDYWGAFKDKFGVMWMVNHSAQQS